MNSNEAFVIEKNYNVPVEKAWKAITDKVEMKQWYFDLAEFKPEVGFDFSFKGGPEDGKQYLHICKITEVIINKKITYSWRYEGYEGISFVTFELFDEQNSTGKNQTRLRLTHSGLESFPKPNTDFARENFANGWTHILGTSLTEYLQKSSIKV